MVFTQQDARREFPTGSGYLDAATMGLPPRAAIEALSQDLVLWGSGRRNPADYGAMVERGRGAYAQLVGFPSEWVALGSQTSVMASITADAVPRGAEVLVVDGDFTSIVFPFLVRDEITTRSVPLDALASEISDSTAMVVFSLVQSSTGVVAPVDDIREAAAAVGAITVCDTTQAVGVYPVRATLWDVTLCHAYKWLCCPRGVGFMTVAPRVFERLRPIQAGWYAGDDVWRSIYGPDMRLASTARRFDISPSWQSWVGAAPALELFASLDMNEVWSRATELADTVLAELGEEPRGRAILALDDPNGTALAAVRAAGLTASGRDGRARLSFHIWNDDTDVLRVTNALLSSELATTRPASSSSKSP